MVSLLILIEAIMYLVDVNPTALGFFGVYNLNFSFCYYLNFIQFSIFGFNLRMVHSVRIILKVEEMGIAISYGMEQNLITRN